MPACTSVNYECSHVWCPQRAEEGILYRGTGVKNTCETAYGCWEQKSGLLGKPPVLLTPAPSLHPQILLISQFDEQR